MMIQQDTTVNLASIGNESKTETEETGIRQLTTKVTDADIPNTTNTRTSSHVPFYNLQAMGDAAYMPVDYDSILRHKEESNIEISKLYRLGTSTPDRDIACSTRAYSLNNDSCITTCILVMFAFISVIIYNNGTFLTYRIKDFFTNKRKYIDGNTKANSSEVRNTLILSSVSCMSACLILFNDMNVIRTDYTDGQAVYPLLATGFLICMAFIFTKALLYVFTNWIFFTQEQGRKWISSYFLLTSLSAFVLFPLALIEIYSIYELSQIKLCLPVVFILYEVLLFYKLCANFRIKKHGFPLIFLYFCSVEIMPSFVLWHIFNGASESFIVKI